MKKHICRVTKDIKIRATFVLEDDSEEERQGRLSVLIDSLQGCLINDDGGVETSAGESMLEFSSETMSEYVEETVEEDTIKAAQAALTVMSKEYVQNFFHEDIVDVIFAALNSYIEKQKEGNTK